MVLWELVKKFSAGFEVSSAEEYKQKDGETSEPDNGYRRQFYFTLAWIGAFALLIWLLGFVVGLPLFVFAYVKTYEKGWRWAIMLPIIMFLIAHVGFATLLETPLYEGLLFL